MRHLFKLDFDGSARAGMDGFLDGGSSRVIAVSRFDTLKLRCPPGVLPQYITGML
jgi:hypothetical protein